MSRSHAFTMEKVVGTNRGKVRAKETQIDRQITLPPLTRLEDDSDAEDDDDDENDDDDDED